MNRLLLTLYFNEPLGQLQLGTKARFFIFLEELLSRLDNLKINLYFSGFVLEWIEREKDEFFVFLKPFIQSGKVEILINGFYEPNFSLISRERIIDQIGKSQNFWLEKSGVIPDSMFMPRMIYSPVLEEILPGLGIKRLILTGDTEPENGAVAVSSSGLSVYTCSLRLSRRVFLEGCDFFKKNREFKSVMLTFPAELFTNRAGSDWFFEILSAVSESDLITELLKNSDSEQNVIFSDSGQPDLGDCLWQDIVYNFPYYYFFQDNMEKIRGPEIDGSFMDYLKSIPEMWEMYRQFRGSEQKLYHSKDQVRAKKILGNLEFYGYLWPGVFGGLNYSALRQNFFRSLILLDELPAASADNAQTDSGILSTDLFNLHLDSQTAALNRLDFKPLKCNVVNLRKNYSRILDWRDKLFGKLEKEVEIPGTEGRVPEFLSEKFSCSFTRELDFSRNISEKYVRRLETAWRFHAENSGCRVIRTISLRESNQNIFVRYLIENTGTEQLNTVFTVAASMGLSHPGFSRNVIRSVSLEEKLETGFENSRTVESVEEVSVCDGMLGIEVSFRPEGKPLVKICPDYLVDRLPDQYQKLFQGSNMDFCWDLKIEKGESRELEIQVRFSEYV